MKCTFAGFLILAAVTFPLTPVAEGCSLRGCGLSRPTCYPVYPICPALSGTEIQGGSGPNIIQTGDTKDDKNPLSADETSRINAIVEAYGMDATKGADLAKTIQNLLPADRAGILKTYEDQMPKSSPLNAKEKDRFEKATKGWDPKERDQMLKTLMKLESKDRDSTLKVIEDTAKDDNKEESSEPISTTILVVGPRDAKLRFDEHQTKLVAPVSAFVAPPLNPTVKFTYTVALTTNVRGTPVVQTQRVSFAPGRTVRVYFETDPDVIFAMQFTSLWPR